MSDLNPQFPLYIPSKGRYDSRQTSKFLDSIKVPYKLVVEPQEYAQYLDAVGDENKVLKLDMSYKEKYELCDEHGLNKTTGGGPARNFIWDHSISQGYKWHWIMDDNIRSFRRMNKNEKVKVSNGSIFKAMEDFALRYKNVAMCGPNYTFFAPSKTKKPPITMNTRIYSCNLIRNDIPYRWRGRYNEDTILSLDALTKGWCTFLFNAFLQEKSTTQTVKGGNTDELYKDGTLDKSKMLVNLYPKYARLVWRYERWHHHVDYSPFQKNLLVRKENVKINKGVNNYGMKLKEKR